MFLYILENSVINKYYIGITEYLERRIEEHNFSSNHYTGKQKGQWKLIFTKFYEEENQARTEEKRLKKCKNRKYLEWYIKNSGTVAQR